MVAPHTRARHTSLTEFRIERIAQRMRQFRYRNGQTVRELAAEWTLSEDRVAELAAEASKRVLAEVTDPEGVTRDVGAAMQRIMVDSLRDAQEARKAKHFTDAAALRRVAVAAGKNWVTLAGLIGRKGPAHGGTMQFSSTAEAVAFLDAVKADLVGHEVLASAILEAKSDE